MAETIGIALQNLLAPMVLFFALGLGAAEAALFGI